MANNSTEVLANFGTEITPDGSIVCSEWTAIQRPTHSFVPAAITAFAIISPEYATEKFEKTLLADVVLKRSSMDSSAAVALARICGVNTSGASPGKFYLHLLDVIRRYNLQSFFARFPARPAMYDNDIRPLGAAYHEGGGWDEQALSLWRKNYRTLPPAKQMLVATILLLYHDRLQNRWLIRLPHKWHAVDAICCMRDAGYLGDWAKLMATYPGW